MRSSLSYDAADGLDPPSSALTVQVLTDGDELLMRLEGELDFAAAPELLAQVNDTWDSADKHAVRLDLSRLAFLDAAGARALLTVHDRAASAGRRLVVDGMASHRLPVAEFLDLRTRLPVDPSKGTHDTS